MQDPLSFIKAANARSERRRALGNEVIASSLAAASTSSADYTPSGSAGGVVPMSGSYAPPKANGQWVNPLSGRLTITSPYGPRIHPIKGKESFHTGEDLAAKMGTPVFAVSDGVVRTATPNGGAYGNQVILGLSGGLETMYGHLSRFTVRAGQRVRKGQVIGYVGSTGLSTGPHLHFETSYRGKTVNPNRYLNAR